MEHCTDCLYMVGSSCPAAGWGATALLWHHSLHLTPPLHQQRQQQDSSVLPPPVSCSFPYAAFWAAHLCDCPIHAFVF